MRATILPYAVILTKAHRAAVGVMVKGRIVAASCLLCVSYFYYPTISISLHYNAIVFIS